MTSAATSASHSVAKEWARASLAAAGFGPTAVRAASRTLGDSRTALGESVVMAMARAHAPRPFAKGRTCEGHRQAGVEMKASRRADCMTRDALCLAQRRSEEHTSELQSLRHLVCRL